MNYVQLVHILCPNLIFVYKKRTTIIFLLF